MIASSIKVLSDAEQTRIHEAALTVLEQAGMRLEEDQLIRQLKARGAVVDARGRIRMPRQLVAECLSSVDRRPKMKCVNGKALLYGPQDRHYASLVTDPFIVDYREGVRKPRLEDIARHARLGDALPLIDSIHLMDDTIPGLDPATSELKGLEKLVSNTTTCYHCAPGSLRGTHYWIDIAQIMAGGDLKQNPILAAYVPSVSPLTLTGFNTQQLRLFLAAGVLCSLGPCAIAGATAPYTVAGLVVQSWAEFLAMVVAVQVIQPGAPVVGGGGGAHHMDMSTGESIYSGMSKALASAAINELCAWLDLPTGSGNFTTLCSNYGVQNGMESALGVFATFFSRVNNFGGMGSLANACGMSAVQIVLHHQLVEMLERFRRGIDTAEKMIGLDSIVAIGPRGNFLEDPLTLESLRSDEHFYASCFEQCAGTQDVSTMAERAHELAEELIARQPQVPQDRVLEVRRYVAQRLSELRSA